MARDLPYGSDHLGVPDAPCNNLILHQGIGFNGLSYTITASYGSTSTGSGWSANDVVGTLYYI